MIIYCLGMPSSGSTWLYNVVREILSISGVQHSNFTAEGYQAFMGRRRQGLGKRGQDVQATRHAPRGCRPRGVRVGLHREP